MIDQDARLRESNPLTTTEMARSVMVKKSLPPRQ